MLVLQKSQKLKEQRNNKVECVGANGATSVRERDRKGLGYIVLREADENDVNPKLRSYAEEISGRNCGSIFSFLLGY